MKNIEAGVGAVPTQEKKEKVEGEGKKYIRKENEVIFCLKKPLNIKFLRWHGGAKMLGGRLLYNQIYTFVIF